MAGLNDDATLSLSFVTSLIFEAGLGSAGLTNSDDIPSTDMLTEGGDPMITETSSYMVTE